MAPFNFIFLSFEVLPLQCMRTTRVVVASKLYRAYAFVYSHPDNDNYSLA